jgi:hypothetical protein
MRKLSLLLGALAGWSGLGAPPTAAANAAATDTSIRTTILIRAKASECPPGFTIFQMNSGAKLPSGPKICFVRAPKPANK